MTTQEITFQLLKVHVRQEKVEEQVEILTSVLSHTNYGDWNLFFAKSFTTIKDKMSQLQNRMFDLETENKQLHEEIYLRNNDVQYLDKLLRSQINKCSKKEMPANVKKVICGGLMDKEIDENVRFIADQIKDEVIQKAITSGIKVDFSQFTPILAKSQVVAGVNWFLKIQTSDDSYLHVRVWAKFDRTFEVTDVQFSKSANDILQYF